MTRATKAIRWSNAWAIYEAQMADHGIKVVFGEALDRDAAELETRWQHAWDENH